MVIYMNKKVLDKTQKSEDNLTDTQTDIAYIVLCHDEPQLLRRVALALKYRNDRVFVHVDKKSNISLF